MINVNAYHQPGVEAGKKAAEKIIRLQATLLALIGSNPSSVSKIAANLETSPETIFKLCEHLAANGRLIKHDSGNPFDAQYRSL
jgi:glucose-6-phosphate isomerase